MKCTDAAVEAACQRMYGPDLWEHLHGSEKDTKRAWMRFAVEAALPLLDVDAGNHQEPQEPHDGYDLVERFWEATWPTLAACADECGTCKPCITRWAVTWSLFATSNPDLVAKAETDGPWRWTVATADDTETSPKETA